ncbi:hypothetical protein PBY51_001982 [Eleginops maclovinus]|uniref:Uncharacterized protein n=1 Tax=Eleginops maclovinus TaxID=56733 RepID=A0AAN7WYI3_ELEMC|nr:hypothetical protein PBY51_001982 [Eleginops maclovinus]
MVDCSYYRPWPNKASRSGGFPLLYRFPGRLTSCFSIEILLAPLFPITCMRCNNQNYPGSSTTTTYSS